MSDFYNKYPYTDFHELNLDWVIERVKKLTEDWAATLEEWNSTEEQWQQLYDYVHDYFDNLDVQQEINNKINAMIADGTFVTITTPVIEAKVTSMMPGVVSDQIGGVVATQIGPTVASQIGGTVASQIDAAVVTPVNDWLTAHITQPTTPVVDTSLTISGAAADAEVTGDRFKYYEYIDDKNSIVTRNTEKVELADVVDITANKYYAIAAGNLAIGTGTNCAIMNKKIPLYANCTYHFTTNLLSPNCIITQKDSLTAIDSLNNVWSAYRYTPTSDVDLYISYTNDLNVSIYQEFNTASFNPMIVEHNAQYNGLMKHNEPFIRNYEFINLADTDDITLNQYYSKYADNTLRILGGTQCSRLNYKIRLYAGYTYSFNSLYIGFCMVCTKNTVNVIDSLGNLIVGNKYTPAADVDLYVTYSDNTSNSSIYQEFTNGTFNPNITQGNNIYIVVDINGNGQFTDIQDAIDFAIANYDVQNEPVTIFIKNGLYEVTPSTTYPFYAIDKGSNKISIIGETRDGTVIRGTCTDTAQGIVLNVGGECTIENLTIENIADATYNAATILPGNHRPYCIHNDSGFSSATNYMTVIKNCKCYSECDTPIGAGMQNNQIQRYENCELIYTANAVIKQQGSLYIHAPINPAAVSKGLEVFDCTLVCLNNQHAISIGNVTGSQEWNSIPQTYVRNVTYSPGTELHLDGSSAITLYSKLNSNAGLNA